MIRLSLLRTLPWILPGLCWILACGGEESPAPPPAPDHRPLPGLEPGATVTHPIAAGDSHSYVLQLRPGDFVEITLEQNGDNLGLGLGDPEGRTVVEVDTPNGAFGRERLFAVAETGGTYRAQAKAHGGVGGEYSLRYDRRPATPRDRRRARACRLLYRGWLSEAPRDELEELEELRKAEEALELWRQLGDGYLEAVTGIRLGRLHRDRSAPRQAVESLRASWQTAESQGLHDLAPAILLELGQSLEQSGESEDAARALRRALAAAIEAGDRWREGVVCNELGRLLYDLRREPREALGLLIRAVEIFAERRDPKQRAHALHNRGRVLLWLGREEEAAHDLDQALALKRHVGDELSLAKTLLEIGWVHLGRGDEAGAEDRMRAALRMAAGRDLRLEASCFDRLGTHYRRQGRLAEARAAYRRALDGFRALEDRGNEAHALSNLGRVHAELGDRERAFELFDQALRAFEERDDRSGRAYAFANRAWASIRRDDLLGAIRDLGETLTLHETLRAETGGPAFRASYVETVFDHFQSYIDLAMELETREPGRGWLAEALAGVERSRARSLLDLVSKIDLTGPRDGERAGSSSAPRAPETSLPRPRSQEEIRRALDPDTALLVFALGPDRSFVWLVGSETTTWGVLPAQEVIVQEVRSLVQDLRRPPDVFFRGESLDDALENLGELLLGPLGAASSAASLPRRLVVVPAGPLHYLPFGALRLDGRYLHQNHEVSRLPSASVLVALRERRARAEPPPGLVAVMSDPVFTPDDPRFDAAAAAAAARAWAPGSGAGIERLPRLQESAREGEALMEGISGSAGCQWSASGFDANRDAVLGGRLGDFRLLHLATHAVLEDDSPELSRIVLSQFDLDGRLRPGAVRSGDIARLDLSADLVVLSACETALGEQIDGEGLVGLPQSFFEAGADRVVVSLWSVDDRATARMMERFYQELLGEGASPGEALRRAQMAMRQTEGFAAPYYWAPFILVGDWAPLPSTLFASPCLHP